MGLTRRAMAEWGKPRTLKTDNGSDYTAEQYELGLTQIDPAMHVLCDPYQPQQKPHIERGIGDAAADLGEALRATRLPVQPTSRQGQLQNRPKLPTFYLYP